jgi:hypothetical protein
MVGSQKQSEPQSGKGGVATVKTGAVATSESKQLPEEMKTAKTSDGKAGKGGVLATTTPQAPVTKPAEADKNVLSIRREPGEDFDVALVKTRLHPVTSATATIRGFEKPMTEHGFASLVTELSRHVEDVKAGNMSRPETILLMQAQTLDVIFNAMAQRAAVNVGTHRDTADLYLRMALKAQAQCRSTIETLAEIKAPRSTSFIKQQNVANQQQVNNGSQVNNGGATNEGATPAHAHGKNINPNQENKQLEVQHGERLDSTTTGAAIGADSQLEAVGAVHRPADNGREKAQ